MPAWIVFEFSDDLFLVLHLMVAGRLHWKPPGAKAPGKIGLAAFDFAEGALVLTEAGTKRRASLHAVRGGDGIGEHRVYFMGEGELIEVTHRASSRELFARGAVRAARFVAKAKPKIYSMMDALG